MKKKKPTKKPAIKRRAGKKLFNFALYIDDVNDWKEHVKPPYRSLTALLEDTMNEKYKKKKK